MWNKLPAAVTQAVLELALKEPELSPRELAVSFVDQRQYFVSEASVYRLSKAHDLITSPAFILIEGSRQLRPRTQSALANRLYLSAGDRLGLALSVNRAR